MRHPIITAILLGGLAGSAFGQNGVVNTSLVGEWDGFSGSYADVWAEGDLAFIGHFGHASIDIIDISNPAAPFHVVEYMLPPPNTGASAQDVKVHGGLLFVSLEGGGNSVHIVDVRDPENPVGLVDIAINGFTAVHNTFYDNGYLYMADSGTPRMAIVDLTDFDPDDPPAEPISTTKWMVEGVGTSFVHDVTVVAGRAYASAWDSGVWVYDVTNIVTQAPQFLGSGPGENTHSCWPTDDGQYVITGEERLGGGIIVYRITEIPDGGDTTLLLEITDSVALPTSVTSSVHNQVAIGNRVFNSWYGAGLQIYDVDPTTGLLDFVASYDTPELESTWGVYPFLGPDRVLLSDIDDGLLVVSVDVPASGDVNGDGVVDVLDLLAVLAAWGDCPAPPAACPADATGDGTVNVLDLLLVLAEWS